MEANIRKLQDKFSGRYKDAGFSPIAAKEENRDREAEAKIVAESSTSIPLLRKESHGEFLNVYDPTIRLFESSGFDRRLVALPEGDVHEFCLFDDGPTLWYDFKAERWKSMAMAGSFHPVYRAYARPKDGATLSTPSTTREATGEPINTEYLNDRSSG